jgi:hypothetical protein
MQILVFKLQSLADLLEFQVFLVVSAFSLPKFPFVVVDLQLQFILKFIQFSFLLGFFLLQSLS